MLQNIFSDHNKIQLEINNQMISGKSVNIWKLNNTFLSNPYIKDIPRRVKKYFGVKIKDQNLCDAAESIAR